MRFFPLQIFFTFNSLVVSLCYSAQFKDFDDSIQYKLNWPGKSDALKDDNHVFIVSCFFINSLG